MKQNNWKKPNSFAETVELAESFVRREIIRETKDKQLCYHTIDHAVAVKRRAKTIFRAIRSTLSDSQPSTELERLESLIGLCAMAHDMIQQFSQSTELDTPRKRIPGISEAATANKSVEYLKNLNQILSTDCPKSLLFQKRDLEIIKDGILATICDRDPQAGKAVYSFSEHSIYQPYLYDTYPKISIVGRIIALADLGTLGIDGVAPYLKEGILVFLEDNLDIRNAIANSDRSDLLIQPAIKARLLNMARFIVDLARERKARFEVEIAGFSAPARQILRENVFVHLNRANIQKIEAIVPTDDSVSLAELIDFFRLDSSI